MVSSGRGRAMRGVVWKVNGWGGETWGERKWGVVCGRLRL